MNEDAYRELREISWRRKLTPPEEAALQQYLAAHPAEQAEWLEEAALEDMLELLPAAPPVASNFTALVLEAARREDAARERERAPAWLYGRGVRSWLPKFAFATGLVGIVAIGYHTQQVRAREALARNVTEVTAAVAASDPDLMQDFEPIRQLSAPQPKADAELLALLK